jgi:hypothetical protein
MKRKRHPPPHPVHGHPPALFQALAPPSLLHRQQGQRLRRRTGSLVPCTRSASCPVRAAWGRPDRHGLGRQPTHWATLAVCTQGAAAQRDGRGCASGAVGLRSPHSAQGPAPFGGGGAARWTQGGAAHATAGHQALGHHEPGQHALGGDARHRGEARLQGQRTEARQGGSGWEFRREREREREGGGAWGKRCAQCK